MAPNAQPGTKTESATLKAYQDAISGQVKEAKAKLELLEATAREKKAQAEIAAIGSLSAARQNLERKLKELRTTHESNVTRAKADIDAEITQLKASVEQLAARFKAPPKK